jgi:hypothetical protein
VNGQAPASCTGSGSISIKYTALYGESPVMPQFDDMLKRIVSPLLDAAVYEYSAKA